MDKISIQRFGNGLANEEVTNDMVTDEDEKSLSYASHPILIPLPYGREMSIYANMMSKFLAQGGTVSTAFVEIDLEENKYTCVLWGDNGSKFLFSTQNLDLRNVRDKLPGRNKMMMASKYGLPKAIESRLFRERLNQMPLIKEMVEHLTDTDDTSLLTLGQDTMIPTIEEGADIYSDFETMDCVRPVKISLTRPSVSRLYPNDRYYSTWDRNELTARDNQRSIGRYEDFSHMVRVISGYSGIGYGVRDQIVQNAVSLTEEVNRRSHAFSVGYGSFSIPLLATSNRNESIFTAHQLLSREGLLDSVEGKYTGRSHTRFPRFPNDETLNEGLSLYLDPKRTNELNTNDMGFEFTKGTVFLNLNKLVFDERYLDDEMILIGLRMIPVTNNSESCLDWVSPTTAMREPMDSIWDMMKVAHLIEQPKGTLGKWFTGVRKYHPRGFIRLQCDGNRVTSTVINPTEKKKLANSNIVYTNPIHAKTGVETTGCLEYYTYNKWIGSRKRIDMSIGNLMSQNDSELIGIDKSGRFLFGMATESGTNCLITMNPINPLPPNEGTTNIEISKDPHYRKWLEFAIEFCHKRDYEVDTSIGKVFTIYTGNSGELTQEDVDAYNRLK